MTTTRTNRSTSLRRTAAAVAIPLLAMGVLLATARIAWATCNISCATGRTIYNDWYNDYTTKLVGGVCINYLNADASSAKCGTLESTQRATLSGAKRYCGAIGYRGENYTGVGTPGSYSDSTEPTKCAYGS